MGLNSVCVGLHPAEVHCSENRPKEQGWGNEVLEQGDGLFPDGIVHSHLLRPRAEVEF